MVNILISTIVISLIILVLLVREGTKSHPTDEQFKEWLNNKNKEITLPCKCGGERAIIVEETWFCEDCAKRLN